MKKQIDRMRSVVAAVLLCLMVVTTTACGSGTTATVDGVGTDRSSAYTQLERGDSVAGQQFGDWVVSTSQGLISDAYVRDNNKLGVVITEKVKPTEVKTLAKALALGFRNNFPNQDLTILMYAPDKERILTAKYDVQTNNIEYQG